MANTAKKLTIRTDELPCTPRPPSKKTSSVGARPQSARRYGEEAGDAPSGRARMPLSARDPRPAWGAGGGVEAVLSPASRGLGVADLSPIRPLSALVGSSSPRMPRHHQAIRDATGTGTNVLLPDGGYIGAAMMSIMQEEWYRAREYPDTAHITPSLTPGADIATTRARKSTSPSRDIQGMLDHLRFASADFQSPVVDQWLQRIFSAKCLDLRLKPSDQRCDRFMHAVRTNSGSDVLNLSQAGLGVLAASAVAAMLLDLEHSHNFHTLDLSGNSLLDRGSTAIGEMLSRHGGLRRLDLRSNNIGQEGGSALFKALALNSSLTELDLGILLGGSRNRVGLTVCKDIAQALKLNRSIQHLSLYGNGMGPEGAALFCEGLAGNLSLKRLDLSLNNLKDQGTVHIASALQRGAQLESLNLSQNHMSTRGVAGLSEAISSGNLFIQSLELSSNRLGAKAAELLGRALATNSQLTALMLDKNELGAEGGKALALGLQGGCLATLALGSNLLDDAGVEAVARQLHGNIRLTRLDVSNNGFGDRGAGALAAMLRHNNKLSTLALNDNRIGDNGGLALAHALLSNSSLLSLNLRHNKVQDATASALVATLMTNTSITALDMEGNDVNFANASSIGKLVSEHARVWQQNAAPRLRKQLHGMRRQEAMLAGKEGELAALLAGRDGADADAVLKRSEAAEISLYTRDKLEEIESATAEANASLAEGKARLAAVLQALDAQTKEQGGEEAKANKVLRLAQDEVRQDKIRRDKLLQETLEEEEELAAEEARILAEMAFLKERGAAATSVKEANTKVILEQEGEAFDLHALLEQAPSVDMSDAPVYVSPPRQDASSHEEAEEDAEALSHEPVVPQVAPSDNGDTPGSPSAMRSQAQGSVMHTHEMHAGKAQGRTASSASKASQGSATTTVKVEVGIFK